MADLSVNNSASNLKPDELYFLSVTSQPGRTGCCVNSVIVISRSGPTPWKDPPAAALRLPSRGRIRTPLGRSLARRIPNRVGDLVIDGRIRICSTWALTSSPGRDSDRRRTHRCVPPQSCSVHRRRPPSTPGRPRRRRRALPSSRYSLPETPTLVVQGRRSSSRRRRRRPDTRS